jgi:hypothetical protein
MTEATKDLTGQAFLDALPELQFAQVIENYFTIDRSVAEVIAHIIDNEFDTLDKQIEEFMEEASEAGIEDLTEEIDRQAESLQEKIETYMIDFDLDEDGGHSGKLYTLKNGQEYSFADDDAIEEEAEGSFESLLDDMMSDPDYVKKHIIPSWESGQTRSDFIKECADRDSLSSYDGNTTDFRSSDGTSFVYYRTN